MLQDSSLKSSQIYFARCGGAHPSINTQKAKAGCDWEATLSTQQVPGQLELYSETLSYQQTDKVGGWQRWCRGQWWQQILSRAT